MKVGCVFFPHFAVQVEWANDPSIRGKTLIFGGDSHEKKPVYEASENAIERGVRLGMPLREAYGLCPDAVFLPPDEEKYILTFESILAILSSFTPLVEMAALGCAFIGLDNHSEDLNAGKKIGTIIKEKTELNSSISFGSSKFVTWACCQIIEPGHVVKIPAGKEGLFLKDLPLDLLPGSEDILRRFHLLGLDTLGELAILPLKAIDKEFGREGKLLWELAKGIDHSTIRRWSGQQIVEEGHSFEYPAESSRQILEHADTLLERLESGLKGRGQCSRKLVASLSLADNSPVRKVFHFKDLAYSKEVILNRLIQWLAETTFESPVVEIKLTLSDLGPREGKQFGLLDTGLKSKSGLSSTLKSLKVRFGKAVIKRAILTDSKYGLPETSFHFVEFG